MQQSRKHSRRSSRLTRYFATYILAMVALAPMVAPVVTMAAKDGAAAYTCTLDRFTWDGAHPAGSARANGATYEPSGLCERLS